MNKLFGEQYGVFINSEAAFCSTVVAAYAVEFCAFRRTQADTDLFLSQREYHVLLTHI